MRPPGLLALEESRSGPWLPVAILAGSVAVVGVALARNSWALEFAMVVGVVVALAFAHRALLAWPTLLAAILAVIMFIPIRRYVIPGDLPFEIEPYRILIAFVAVGWAASLLVDRDVSLRRSGLEGPIALIVVASLLSVIANPGRVAGVSAEVAKELTFLASFLVFFYLIVSVVRSRQTLDLLVKVLVLGGAVVGFFAIVEARSGYNIFNDLQGVVPALQAVDLPGGVERRGRLRVFGSSQHPIALAAMFVILVPLALYLVKRSARRIWWLPAVVLLLATMAAVSRTAILMLVTAGLVYLWLRPVETKRALLIGGLPMLVALNLLLPGTIGGLFKSFFPEGGIVAEQAADPGSRGGGRLADLGPAFSEYARAPIFGQGYGTRVVEAGGDINALILDNQWLKTLLELGALGALGWVLLVVFAIRRFGQAAREDTSPRGWLLAGITASVAAFAVGMFTYDTFSFIQVTFMLFALLGIGCAALRLHEEEATAAGHTRSGGAARPARMPADPPAPHGGRV